MRKLTAGQPHDQEHRSGASAKKINREVMAMDAKLKSIEIGFQISLEDGGKGFGAVRSVAPGGRLPS